MSETEAKIDFSKLKHFPKTDTQNNNNKIITKAFLDSAYQVVESIGRSPFCQWATMMMNNIYNYMQLIDLIPSQPVESFGRLFSPIVKDMRGNVKVSLNRISLNINIHLTFPPATGSQIQGKWTSILLSRRPHSAGQGWKRKHFRFGDRGTFVAETCSGNDWNVLQKHARGRKPQRQRETSSEAGIR